MFTTFLALDTPYLPDTMSQEAEPKAPAHPVDIEAPHAYDGQGTEQDPFLVEFQKRRPAQPHELVPG